MSLDGSVTSQFNTQQPVHLASSFGRRGEVYIPRVGLGRFKCLLDGFVGRVRQPKAVDGLLCFQTMLDDFIDQSLSFTVRVARVVNHIHVFAVHQAVDDTNQTFNLFFPFILERPVIGKERQTVHRPARLLFRVITRKIRIKVNKFIQVAYRGCNDIVITLQPRISIFTLPLELLVLPPL